MDYNNQLSSRIQFIDCHFANMNGKATIMFVQSEQLISVTHYLVLSIINSTFRNIKADKILVVDLTRVILSNTKPLITKNTSFSAIYKLIMQ